MPFL
jgi:hypothetical protein